MARLYILKLYQSRKSGLIGQYDKRLGFRCSCNILSCLDRDSKTWQSFVKGLWQNGKFNFADVCLDGRPTIVVNQHWTVAILINPLFLHGKFYSRNFISSDHDLKTRRHQCAIFCFLSLVCFSRKTRYSSVYAYLRHCH